MAFGTFFTALSYIYVRVARARTTNTIQEGELAEKVAVRENSEANVLIDKLTSRVTSLESDSRAAEKRTDTVREDCRKELKEIQDDFKKREKLLQDRMAACEAQRSMQSQTIGEQNVMIRWMKRIMKDHGWISDHDEERMITPGDGIVIPKKPPAGDKS